MSNPVLVSSLSGSIGSIVGLIGAMLLYLLARRRERLADAERRREESARRLFEALFAVARVPSVWRTRYVLDAVGGLYATALDFIAEHDAEHHELCGWLGSEVRRLLEDVRAFQRFRGMPWNRRRGQQISERALRIDTELRRCVGLAGKFG